MSQSPLLELLFDPPFSNSSDSSYPQLSVLDITWPDSQALGPAVSVGILNQLRVLKMGNRDIDYLTCQEIPTFNRLTHLGLRNCNIRNLDLATLYRSLSMNISNDERIPRLDMRENPATCERYPEDSIYAGYYKCDCYDPAYVNASHCLKAPAMHCPDGLALTQTKVTVLMAARMKRPRLASPKS